MDWPPSESAPCKRGEDSVWPASIAGRLSLRWPWRRLLFSSSDAAKRKPENLLKPVFLEINQVEIGFDLLFRRGADRAALREGGDLLGRMGPPIDDLVIEISDRMIARPSRSEPFLEGGDDAFIGRIFCHDLLENRAFQAKKIEQCFIVAEG